jgi:hypothetical protein
MRLYRTTDGRLLTLNPDGQSYHDHNGDTLYADLDGTPVNNDGTPVPGHKVTKFTYTPEEYLGTFHAETFRRMLTDPTRPGVKTALVQSLPHCSCLPGGMLIVTLLPAFKHPKDSRWDAKPRVSVNDGDDGYRNKTFDTDQEAEQAFNELLTLAPYHMAELETLGYQPG